MAKFGKELAVRTLTGAALLLIVTGAVFVSEYGFVALLLTICVGSMWEFYRMAARKEIRIERMYSVVVGAVGVAMSFLVARGTLAIEWLSLFFPLIFIIFARELMHRQPEPFLNISVAVGGIMYAALPMALMCFVAFSEGFYDARLVLCYIFTVWVNDIFAYLTGVTLGRHHMFERVSPKKSWEGFCGGLVFAVAFGVLCGMKFLLVQALGRCEGFRCDTARTRRVHGPFRCTHLLRTVRFCLFCYFCPLSAFVEQRKYRFEFRS